MVVFRCQRACREITSDSENRVGRSTYSTRVPAPPHLDTDRTPADAYQNFQNAQHRHTDFTGTDNACRLPYIVKPVRPSREKLASRVRYTRGEYGGSASSSYRWRVQQGLWIIGWNTDYFQPQFFCRVRSTLLKPAQRRAIYLTPCFSALPAPGGCRHRLRKYIPLRAIGSFSGFFRQQKVKKFQLKPKDSFTCCRYFLSYCFVL